MAKPGESREPLGRLLAEVVSRRRRLLERYRLYDDIIRLEFGLYYCADFDLLRKMLLILQDERISRLRRGAFLMAGNLLVDTAVKGEKLLAELLMAGGNKR